MLHLWGRRPHFRRPVFVQVSYGEKHLSQKASDGLRASPSGRVPLSSGLPCWVRQILCPWAGDAPGELVMSKTSELVADILWLLCGSCVQMRSSQSPVTTNNGTVSSMASCAE